MDAVFWQCLASSSLLRLEATGLYIPATVLFETIALKKPPQGVVSLSDVNCKHLTERERPHDQFVSTE